MTTREQAQRALTHYRARLMADPGIAYICTRPLRAADGHADWVIEIGLQTADAGASLPRALPLPPDAGPGEVRLHRIISGPVETLSQATKHP